MRQVQQLVRHYHYLIVAGLLLVMFGLGITSMAGDSAIVDEVAHIPAGYSYLHYGDYRLNPEHPPLIKELAGLPLQFMNLDFPVTNPAWTTAVNGQWESGWHFLYHDGNNAGQILFYARLPILILSVVFGFILYEICRRRFGLAVGLLVVFFYALEPNIMAHSRLVTTDIGATVMIFLATYTFVRFLEKPGLKSGGLATLAFGAAQLAKFSAVLLAPLYLLLAVIAILCFERYKTWWGRIKVYGGGTTAVGLLGLVIIWLYYIPLTLNMPSSVQHNLISASLSPGWKLNIITKLAAYNNLPGIKALTQYVLGVLMVLGRVAGGNTTYFLGKVSNQSFFWYFPVTYLIKTPVALLLLIVVTTVAALIGYFAHKPSQVWGNFKQFSRQHFLRLAGVAFIIIYTYFSISGNLNLGIRHLLPMFPFIFVLVAYATVALWRRLGVDKPWPLAVLIGLLGYFAYANLAIYPSYLAYFNELIGGPNNAYKYVSDSSIDWGQDLVRLKSYVQSHDINQIAVDYFGGGEPKYYFCDRIYRPDGSLVKDSSGYDCSHSPYIEWHAQYGMYQGQYMAVSETYLENDLYYAKQSGRPDAYVRLRTMQPVVKIGHSIYVYKLY